MNKILVVCENQEYALRVHQALELGENYRVIGVGEALAGSQFDRVVVLFHPSTIQEMGCINLIRCRVKPGGEFIQC